MLSHLSIFGTEVDTWYREISNVRKMGEDVGMFPSRLNSREGQHRKLGPPAGQNERNAHGALPGEAITTSQHIFLLFEFLWYCKQLFVDTGYTGNS